MSVAAGLRGRRCCGGLRRCLLGGGLLGHRLHLRFLLLLLIRRGIRGLLLLPRGVAWHATDDCRRSARDHSSAGNGPNDTSATHSSHHLCRPLA